MKTMILILTQMIFSSDFNDITIKEIKEKSFIVKPKPTISHSSTISVYKTDEIFTFEDQAKKTCNERFSILKNYGVSVIGCNVIEKDGDYTFTIDYIAELKESQRLNSILIEDYISSKSYWNETLAKKEMENSFLRFKNSQLKPIEKTVIEMNGEYYFKISYVVNNILKRSSKYYVNFEKFLTGSYPFESEAEKNITKIMENLKILGIAVVRGSVVEKNDKYFIEIEYINKRDNISTLYKNPEYSLEKYISDELFPFEDTALKEGTKRNDSFLKLSIPVILNYSIQKENDWSFGIDYFVKNIYKNGLFVGKEYRINRYTSSQIFDFENEAKKELNERLKNLNSIGVSVISYKVFETEAGYSFLIDYLEKTN